MDSSVAGKLGGGPAEKFIPWKKRGLSESPVDFASQQDGLWDGPEVKKQRREEEMVGEEEEMVGFVAGRGSGEESNVGNPIVGQEVCLGNPSSVIDENTIFNFQYCFPGLRRDDVGCWSRIRRRKLGSEHKEGCGQWGRCCCQEWSQWRCLRF